MWGIFNGVAPSVDKLIEERAPPLLKIRIFSNHYDPKDALFSCVRMADSRGRYSYIFSVRGRAAEQGIIFRIQTPGQGIIFVQIGSMTGSIFFILTPKGRFRPFALCECDSNRFDGNISTIFDRFRTNFLAEHNFVQGN